MKIEYDVKAEEGEYPVTFTTAAGTAITKTIYVKNNKVVENRKKGEAVMAFDFFTTVDEIRESQVLDTDLKTWASAQGWKLANEDEAVDIYTVYDFDPAAIKVGTYKVTFTTEGRELKVRTTDYVEAGSEVGIKFGPEDIHVMHKQR